MKRRGVAEVTTLATESHAQPQPELTAKHTSKKAAETLSSLEA